MLLKTASTSKQHRPNEKKPYLANPAIGWTLILVFSAQLWNGAAGNIPQRQSQRFTVFFRDYIATSQCSNSVFLLKIT